MKTIFEEMGGTYRQVGYYFIPNITLPDDGEYQIGKYGRMRRSYRVCQVFCVSFKKIFWGGEPPHLYHPTLLNDTLLKYFGNISNRVSCQ